MKTKKMLFTFNILNTVKVILFAMLFIVSFVSLIIFFNILKEGSLLDGYEMTVVALVGVGFTFALIGICLIISFVVAIVNLLSLIYSVVVYRKVFKRKNKPGKNNVKFLKSDCIQKIVIASIELIAIIFAFVIYVQAFAIAGILVCINVAYIVFVAYTLKTISSEKLELETYVRS